MSSGSAPLVMPDHGVNEGAAAYTAAGVNVGVAVQSVTSLAWNGIVTLKPDSRSMVPLQPSNLTPLYTFHFSTPLIRAVNNIDNDTPLVPLGATIVGSAGVALGATGVTM